MGTDRSSSLVDLVAVSLAAGLPVVVVSAGVQSTALRILVVLPLLLFLPGYALLSVLYPEAREDCDPPLTHEAGDGIDKAMRSRLRGLTVIDFLGLSVAASIALTPTVAVAEHAVRGTLTPLIQVVALAGLTVGLSVLALLRRLSRPANARYAVPLGLPAFMARYFEADSGRLGNTGAFEARNQSEVLVNVFVAGALVLALTGAALAVTQSPAEQDFEELAVLTENADGDYEMGNYPDDLSGSEPLFVSVTNNRDAGAEYVVVGTLETVDQDGEVQERDEQLRQSVEIGSGERVYVRHDPAASLSGERLRLRYDLYTTSGGEPEDDPVRSVYLWISGEGSVTTETPEPVETAEGADGDEGQQTATPEGSPTQSPTPEETPTPEPTETEEDDGFPF